MQTAEDLRAILQRIDRRGYPAYQDTRGTYRFPGYVLSIDHVQKDPFAAPSRLSIRVEGSRVWMTGEAVTVFTGTVEI